MALCGFNEKMLSGLRLFGVGLLEQAEERMRLDNASMQEVFSNEILEMEHFLEVLSSRDLIRYQSLVAVTNLAQALYKNGRGLPAPREVYMAKLQQLIANCAAMDAEYYENLRPNAESPQVALEQLGVWVDGNWVG